MREILQTMSKRSVLLVDDDESFRGWATLLLKERGYTAEAAENGDQLIERLSSGEMPSIILLDVLLKDSDGIEVMRKIKTAGVTIPVIMLSGLGHVRTVVEAMKLGASDFLTKPFDDDALDKAITRAVAFFCGLGQHELQINGQIVGEDILDPGWTNYRKSCLYAMHDVRSFLKQGENILTMFLGNGMYNVTVDVEYSTLNYKDGLILTGQGRLVRVYPHVPGVDFAGTVERSDSPDFKSGDKVVLTGWRVGEAQWGGYAQKARVKSSMLAL